MALCFLLEISSSKSIIYTWNSEYIQIERMDSVIMVLHYHNLFNKGLYTMRCLRNKLCIHIDSTRYMFCSRCVLPLYTSNQSSHVAAVRVACGFFSPQHRLFLMNIWDYQLWKSESHQHFSASHSIILRGLVFMSVITAQFHPRHGVESISIGYNC